jgi:hypothetical protein
VETQTCSEDYIRVVGGVEPVIERIIEVKKLDEFASSLNSDERT